jgi:hypothetical protein
MNLRSKIQDLSGQLVAAPVILAQGFGKFKEREKNK